MAKSKGKTVDRRNFPKSGAVGAAALVAEPIGKVILLPMSPLAEVGAPPSAPHVEVLTLGRPGCDFIVDTIKSIGFEYIFTDRGSSFRGLLDASEPPQAKSIPLLI